MSHYSDQREVYEDRRKEEIRQIQEKQDIKKENPTTKKVVKITIEIE